MQSDEAVGKTASLLSVTDILIPHMREVNVAIHILMILLYEN